MKLFKFNLETLKKLRQLELDQAQSLYATAIENRKLAEASVELIEKRHQEFQEIVAQSRKGVFCAAKEDANLGSFKHFQMTLEQGFLTVNKKRKEELEAREAFFNARTKLQGIEKLEEKRKFEHQLETQRKEEKELEDQIQSRWKQFEPTAS